MRFPCSGPCSPTHTLSTTSSSACSSPAAAAGNRRPGRLRPGDAAIIAGRPLCADRRTEPARLANPRRHRRDGRRTVASTRLRRAIRTILLAFRTRRDDVHPDALAATSHIKCFRTFTYRFPQILGTARAISDVAPERGNDAAWPLPCWAFGRMTAREGGHHEEVDVAGAGLGDRGRGMRQPGGAVPRLGEGPVSRRAGGGGGRLLPSAGEARLRDGGPIPFGIVEDDGTFSLSTDDLGNGARPGTYSVLVEWRDESGDGVIAGQDEGQGQAGEAQSRPIGPDRLKGRYFDISKPLLQAEVEAGSNPSRL